MRRELERLKSGLQPLSRQIGALDTTRHLSGGNEEEYLAGPYIDELVIALKAAGIEARRDAESIVAFPVVVRVIPSERTLRIDGKRLGSLRPSSVVAAVKRGQNAKPRLPPERFLELLLTAYRLLSGTSEPGQTIALSRVYQALTLMPGSAATYGPLEFARDLYALDRGGIARTKDGATVSFTASTGTKAGRGVYTFITPEGERTDYHGIRFVEVKA
jgi:hypothetical protein